MHAQQVHLMSGKVILHATHVLRQHTHARKRTCLVVQVIISMALTVMDAVQAHISHMQNQVAAFPALRVSISQQVRKHHASPAPQVIINQVLGKHHASRAPQVSISQTQGNLHATRVPQVSISLLPD